MATTIRLKDQADGSFVDVLIDAVTHVDGVPVEDDTGAPVTAEAQLLKIVHGESGHVRNVSADAPIPTLGLAAATTIDRPDPQVVIGTTAVQVLDAMIAGAAGIRETEFINEDATAVVGIRFGGIAGFTSLAAADLRLFPGDAYTDDSWAGAWSVISDTPNPALHIHRKRA
jgi:hypothetical protein